MIKRLGIAFAIFVSAVLGQVAIVGAANAGAAPLAFTGTLVGGAY